MNRLGILAVPVFLLVDSNLVDYITGLITVKYHTEDINSMFCQFAQLLKSLRKLYLGMRRIGSDALYLIHLG